MTDTRVPPSKVDVPEVLEKNNGNPIDYMGPADEIKIDTEPTKLRPIPGGRRQSTSDSTPKRRATRSKDSGSKTSGASAPGEMPYTAGVVEAGMTQFYAQIGMMVGLVKPRSGEAFVQNAQAMAKSCERVAKESPQMRKVFDSLVTSSAWGEFISAHAPVAAVLAMDFIPAIQKKFNPQQPPQADGGNVPPMNARTS